MNAPAALPLFAANEIVLLRDSEYSSYVREALQAARVSIRATQFVTDVRTQKDRDREVLLLGHAFAEARWRGVSTRVILPALPIGALDVDGNHPFAAFLHNRGVVVRRYVRMPKSLHTKMIIVDDELLIVGSHNWTATSFNSNRELSIAVRSRDVAESCARVFEEYWSVARDFGP